MCMPPITGRCVAMLGRRKRGALETTTLGSCRSKPLPLILMCTEFPETLLLYSMVVRRLWPAQEGHPDEASKLDNQYHDGNRLNTFDEGEASSVIIRPPIKQCTTWVRQSILITSAFPSSAPPSLPPSLIWLPFAYSSAHHHALIGALHPCLSPSLSPCLGSLCSGSLIADLPFFTRPCLPLYAPGFPFQHLSDYHSPFLCPALGLESSFPIRFLFNFTATFNFSNIRFPKSHSLPMQLLGHQHLYASNLSSHPLPLPLLPLSLSLFLSLSVSVSVSVSLCLSPLSLSLSLSLSSSLSFPLSLSASCSRSLIFVLHPCLCPSRSLCLASLCSSSVIAGLPFCARPYLPPSSMYLTSICSTSLIITLLPDSAPPSVLLRFPFASYSTSRRLSSFFISDSPNPIHFPLNCSTIITYMIAIYPRSAPENNGNCRL